VSCAWAWVCAGVLLLAAGCQQEAGKEAAPSGDGRAAAKEAAPRRLSVLTFNVNYSKPKPAEAVDAIRRADADIVCLQEADAAWEKALRGELAEAYPHRVFRCGFFRASGNAVLSRFPLRQEAWFRPRGSLFPVLLVRVETPAGPVHVLNVHLRPPQWLGGPGVHRKEMQSALERCGDVAPLVVLGDFNESNGDGAVGLLKERGMSDALDLCEPAAVTWRLEAKRVRVAARLDHVLCGPGLHCVSARVLRSEASDHLPVLAVFELAGGGA